MSSIDSSSEPTSACNRPPLRDLRWLSRVLAARTSDVLCIALVFGGAVTATWNLWPEVAPPTARAASTNLQWLPPDGGVLQWRNVAGNESAAWMALVDALGSLPPRPNDSKGVDASMGDLSSWPVIGNGENGHRTIRKPPDLPRIAVAVSEADGHPLICGWGMIRQNPDGDWAITVMRAP
jgi:hypothetical protein